MGKGNDKGVSVSADRTDELGPAPLVSAEELEKDVWAPVAESADRRRIIAEKLVSELGLSPSDPHNLPYVHTAMEFVGALELMREKGKEGHSYHRVGWQGSLLDLHRKVSRLMHVGWHTGALEPNGYDPAFARREADFLQNAVDTLNHTAFLLQCYRAGNIRGYGQ